MLPAQAARIDRIVGTVMRDYHIAGCSLGIARNGSVIYLKGYGMRDVERAEPADGYTIYRIGSVTKQFTAAAVMRLVEHHALTLNATAGSYLPALAGAARGVTIEELLRQTSGIPSDTDPGASFASAMNAPLNFDPGTSWEYSNTNYSVLGRVLEATTHISYGTMLENTILRPLHLESTGDDVSPFATNVAIGYQFVDGQFHRVPNPAVNTDPLDAAAGLASNVPDLLQWMNALRSEHVVSAASFRAMSTGAHLGGNESTYYGFGFFVSNWYGWHVIEHPGNVDGYSANDAMILDSGLEIALLTNADRADIVPLTKSILTIVEQPKDPNMYADRPRPPENEDPAVTATVRALFAQLQRGVVDRSKMSPRLSASLDARALRRNASMLIASGTLQMAEFIERTNTRGLRYERYRLTCESGRYWMNLGFARNGQIDALSLLPDDD